MLTNVHLAPTSVMRKQIVPTRLDHTNVLVCLDILEMGRCAKVAKYLHIEGSDVMGNDQNYRF